MNYKKYQKLKAMQSFRQKFSDMIREYRDGFRKEAVVQDPMKEFCKNHKGIRDYR